MSGPLSAHATLDWDDLHYVLAISRAQSLAGAARLLRVSHSTVIRRLKKLEERMGVRLFDRLHDGFLPTAAGRAAIESATRIEDEMLSFQRLLAADNSGSAGTVRVTTTDDLLKVAAPICASFIREHPQIKLELVASNERQDLSRRDADVALRPSNNPGDTLRGRRLASVNFAVYSAASHRCFEDGTCCWVGLAADLAHVPPHGWLDRNVEMNKIIARAGSFTSAAALAEQQAGHTILPCYLGESWPTLRRIGPPLADVESDLWLLVHPDLSDSGRVRAFLDYFARAAFEMRSVLAPALGPA